MLRLWLFHTQKLPGIIDVKRKSKQVSGGDVIIHVNSLINWPAKWSVRTVDMFTVIADVGDKAVKCL